MNKIKNAFNTIQASEELKENTKQYLYKNAYKQKKNYRYVLAIISILIIFFSVTAYITPVAAISIDSESSLQIEVNKFNRVISVTAYDDKTNELIQSLNLKHLDYYTAVDKVINELEEENLIDNSSYLNIAISTKDNNMSDTFLDNIEDEYGQKYQHLKCMNPDTNSQNEAKRLQMSIGKYQEITEIQKDNPNINIDEIKGMSMQEIKEQYYKNGKQKGKKH